MSKQENYKALIGDIIVEVIGYNNESDEPVERFYFYCFITDTSDSQLRGYRLEEIAKEMANLRNLHYVEILSAKQIK